MRRRGSSCPMRARAISAIAAAVTAGPKLLCVGCSLEDAITRLGHCRAWANRRHNTSPSEACMSSMPSRPPRSATCARGQRGAHTSEWGRPVGACRSVASLARLCRATPVGRLSDSGREDSPILPVTRWRASARRAHGGPRWRPRTRHLCCFDFEEAFFRLEAPSKACERTVFADHAMARRHNGDRILSVCRANRSEGARLAD
jgi:hypothetical protein